MLRRRRRGRSGFALLGLCAGHRLLLDVLLQYVLRAGAAAGDGIDELGCVSGDTEPADGDAAVGAEHAVLSSFVVWVRARGAPRDAWCNG